MSDAAPKKSSIANSILAKFQEYSKEKENAAKNSGAVKDSVITTVEKGKKRKHQDEILHSGISEEDVGISKYISDHAGFKGILKHRFTDFQVHEIDCDGNLVELTTTEPIGIPAVNYEVNNDVLSQELRDKIENTLNDKEAVVEIDVNNKDKIERSHIHKTIKHIFGSKVYSNTVTTDGKSVIQVGKATNKERLRWPENLPHFLHFTLAKKNMDTTNFIYLFSRKLRLKPNLFTYAGTKDRRAVTSQRMCVSRKKSEELAKETMWGVKIGNYEYKQKPLRLGELSGNKFTITIRNIQSDEDTVKKAIENLKEKGYINYFGLQRFGSSVVAPTFHVGKALLKRDWKLAVELILKPRPDEKAPPWVKAARESWWASRESGEALRFLSRHQNSIEFKVLKSLKTNPNDFHGALLTIPRNTLLLYLHSYQSYIWNKVVSRRIEKYQLTPQPGDLVYASNEPLVEEEEIPQEASLEKVEEEAEKDEDEEEEGGEEGPVSEIRLKVPVKALTEEDAKNTSIYDVVYPLPGHDVEFPKNDVAEWYTEFLKADNISLDDLKSKNKLFSLYGTYRKPFQHVKDLTWSIKKHKNFDDDLVLSDMDKIENVTLPEQPDDAEHKSVVIDFTLKPSSYATMALREAMKADTSVSFHASMTKSVQDIAEKKAKLSKEESETTEHTNGDKT